ncbi:MAG: hypothetical protein ACREFJ_19365 [Acetobacteraceae bacterium]
MTTLKVRIAGYEEMKARIIAVARDGRRITPRVAYGRAGKPVTHSRKAS